ncbi:uncharacterized protein PHALS_14569 [Plasmopara halstedii]|uniref:Uncharacterized protein n=1 Tax=Plasmopara halstedii TaxID=4781 RepID=A0A0P1AU57_PLAHL|nr:uncharacterized protein PHALS_14569 [Plasmopara halstedii]CEG44919.1 hypothetical protein PHALS_14569 [Plasmopara halstedii]|eukprot:XP_024581288.1 hypothetical protein PHALS_14569 [Plasmopara halstedii]
MRFLSAFVQTNYRTSLECFTKMRTSASKMYLMYNGSRAIVLHVAQTSNKILAVSSSAITASVAFDKNR